MKNIERFNISVTSFSWRWLTLITVLIHTVTFVEHCLKIERYHVNYEFYLKSNFFWGGGDGGGIYHHLSLKMFFITHWVYKMDFTQLVGEHEIRYSFKTIKAEISRKVAKINLLSSCHWKHRREIPYLQTPWCHSPFFLSTLGLHTGLHAA